MLKADAVSVALIDELKIIHATNQGILVEVELINFVKAYSSGKGIAGIAYQTGKSAYTSDYWNDPGIEHTPDLDKRATQRQLIACLVTPVKVNERVVALMWINKHRVYDWTPADIKLTEQFSTLAGLAIYNASLYRNLDTLNNELVARNAELEALQDFNRRLRGPLELKAACERALTVAMEKLEASIGSLYLVSIEDSDEICLMVSQDFPENMPQGSQPLKLSQAFPGLMLATKPSIVINGETDPLSLKIKKLIFPGENWQSYLLIPLLVADKLIGLINFGSDKPNYFTAEKVRFAEMMTRQISAALQQVSQLEMEKEREQLRVVLSLARTAAYELNQPLALLQHEFELAIKGDDNLDEETLDRMQEAIAQMTRLLREYQKLVRLKVSTDYLTLAQPL